jgi:hypothetical protein
MAIHAIDMVCSSDVSPALVGGLNSQVSVWLTSHTAWEPDGDLTQDQSPPSLVNTQVDGSGIDYYRGGVWRFAWEVDDSLLTANIVGQFQAYRPSWWRVRFHECDHDEDGDSGCDWASGETWRGGTVPAEVA